LLAPIVPENGGNESHRRVPHISVPPSRKDDITNDSDVVLVVLMYAYGHRRFGE